jgi:hypothetical protein
VKSSFSSLFIWDEGLFFYQNKESETCIKKYRATELCAAPKRKSSHFGRKIRSSKERAPARRRKTLYFFDGPPTANGKPHIGHVLHALDQGYCAAL